MSHIQQTRCEIIRNLNAVFQFNASEKKRRLADVLPGCMQPLVFALNKKNNILIIFYILIICYRSRCKGPVVIDRRGGAVGNN